MPGAGFVGFLSCEWVRPCVRVSTALRGWRAVPNVFGLSRHVNIWRFYGYGGRNPCIVPVIPCFWLVNIIKVIF